MTSTVTTALDRFLKTALTNNQDRGFELSPDPEWPSPCEYLEEDKHLWRPVKQDPAISFEGLSHALELDIHPDIQAFYGSFFSESFNASASEGELVLLQLWSPRDFDRLRENLIGHALAKRRLKHDFTVFIGTTDTELFLSIDNNTGCILLEEPGKKPLKQVDDNVTSFLNRLSPIGPLEPDLGD